MNTTEWIKQLISRGELWRFYKSKPWLTLKAQVLQDDHYECRICKGKGKVTRYDISEDGTRRRLSTVHHIKEVRKHPELALCRYYYGQDGKRHENLIPVCKACHNSVCHPGKLQHKNHNGFMNQERW